MVHCASGLSRWGVARGRVSRGQGGAAGKVWRAIKIATEGCDVQAWGGSGRGQVGEWSEKAKGCDFSYITLPPIWRGKLLVYTLNPTM